MESFSDWLQKRVQEEQPAEQKDDNHENQEVQRKDEQ